jgi:aspartokinase/homoserine dehydrogenase 1
MASHAEIPRKKVHTLDGGVPRKRLSGTPEPTEDAEGDPSATLPPAGSYVVLKFGGSSVGSPPRLVQVCDTVVLERARDGRAPYLAVVVSAQGSSTDWLIEAADAAAEGDVDTANLWIDKLADLATSNALITAGLNAAAAAAGGGAGVGAGSGSSGAELISLARNMLAPLRQLLLGMSLLREKTPQALDAVLSFGERLSATILAELLLARGVPALFVDMRTLIVTDAHFGAARVDWPATQARVRDAARHWGQRVAVCTGFIGRTPDGKTTTLGRNGSDYTATLLGAALLAERVVISTDVSGVMTADPGIVKDAYPVAALSYMEALELAVYGTRMFHPRTMLPLISTGVPMVIRNTMGNPADAGTKIWRGFEEAGSGGGAAGGGLTGGGGDGSPTCVTSLENLAMLDVRCRQLSTGEPPRIGRRVLQVRFCGRRLSVLGVPGLRALSAWAYPPPPPPSAPLALPTRQCLETANIVVWMATQAAHGTAIQVVVPLAALPGASAAIKAELAAEERDGELDPLFVQAPVTMLSLVQEGLRETRAMAARFFAALGAVSVNILAIAEGARSLSCVIDKAETGESCAPLACLACLPARRAAASTVAVLPAHRPR